MTEYSLYLGCVIPTLYPHVERAVRDVLSSSEVRPAEMASVSCCAPNYMFGLSRQSWLALNKRNLGLAAGTILTACDECFASLQDARQAISEGGKGMPEVKPFLVFLSDQQETLKKEARSLGLRCAIQHSCHLLRPSKVRMVDNPDNPVLMKKALEVVGCTSVPHEEEMSCCGGQASGKLNPGKELAAKKIASARAAGADCIVTTCAHCLNHLTQNSPQFPVLHVAQLYALSLGSGPSSVGVPNRLVRRGASQQ